MPLIDLHYFESVYANKRKDTQTNCKADIYRKSKGVLACPRQPTYSERFHDYHPRKRSVCDVCSSNCWKPWPRNFIFGIQRISSEYLGQFRISRLRSRSQEQEACQCVVRGWSIWDWKAVLFVTKTRRCRPEKASQNNRLVRAFLIYCDHFMVKLGTRPITICNINWQTSSTSFSVHYWTSV